MPPGNQTQERGYRGRSISGNQRNPRARGNSSRVNESADPLGNVVHLAPGNPAILEFDAGSGRILR
jgi:hypothetical protein